MQNSQTNIKSLSYYVTDLQSGSRPKGGVRGIETGIPSVGGEHLNNYGGFDFSSIRFVSPDFAHGMTKGKINQNDILIVKDGATTGKVSFVDKSFPYNDATINEHVFILRTNEKIIPKFLFWYLWGRNGQTEILKNFQGSAQGGINRSFLEGVGVPDHYIEYQKKTVKKIDSILSQCWSDQAKLQKAKKLISKFRQSVLSAAVTGKLTDEWRTNNLPQTKNESVEVDNFPFEIPPSWRVLKIEDIAEYMGGYAYKSTTFLKQGTNQVIRIGNVKQLNIFLDYSPVYIPETIAEETQRFSLQTNDILLSMTGTKYKRDYGFACITPELDDKKLFLNQRVACLRLKTGIPEYLLYYLQTDFFRNYLFEGETGNVNQGNVGSTALRVIPIALPTKDEQEEIVKRIKSMFETADLVEKQIETAGNKADKLTQSILAKAFRGEL